jgi:hypothetical protein
MSFHSFSHSVVAVCSLLLLGSGGVMGQDTVLFSFDKPASVQEWVPVKLPEVEKDQPTAKTEIVSAKSGKGLKLRFDGGDWPALGTTNIPVKGNWKSFQTLKADLTLDRPGVAYFRICQGKPDANEKGKQPCWQRTMILASGRNDVTLMIRHGLSSSVIDPGRGDIASFVIGMYQPAKGQTLLVENIRLSPDWPPPKTLGWYSPYNHDGYSAAVAREFQRTGTVPKFKVLGTDLEVADLPELAKRLKDKWAKPEPKTIEEVEAEFKAEFDKLKRNHPKAVLAILRDGEKDSANPAKVYAGWKMHYFTSHGPDGPNRGREVPQQLGETVEAFMRHRSVLMRADLAGIPKDATILAAKLVVTRTTGAKDRMPPEKANLWVVEPCNRAWDETSANCYFFAPGKHWKAVNGLYYGEDPDYWPVFAAHGPAGGGAVSAWDFAQALKFWHGDGHANHGFFLHGDSIDYMRMYTNRAKDVKQRPAVMVVFEPK